MAIKSVRVQINGVWTNLSLQNGKWTGSITAPSVTSHNLAGGYYPAQIEVTNDAGTVVTKDATDAVLGTALRLYVKETIKPVITLISPSAGALVTNNKQGIKFKVTDETGGSGVNLSTILLRMDKTTYTATSTGMASTGITNGYEFTFTPQNTLTDGTHSITINASDNDGNTATEVSATFKVDTVPPELTITYPQTGLITNKASVVVSGKSNDITSSPVTVSIKLNGTSQGTVAVASDGTFDKEITLAEGTNTIVVTSTDSAGKATSITVAVKLDTSVPKISSVALSPNPVNTSAGVAITIEVS